MKFLGRLLCHRERAASGRYGWRCDRDPSDQRHTGLFDGTACLNFPSAFLNFTMLLPAPLLSRSAIFFSTSPSFASVSLNSMTPFCATSIALKRDASGPSILPRLNSQ